MRSGQGGGQFHQLEGRGRGLPRRRRQMPGAWRRGHRHGLRRAGAGGQPQAPHSDLRALLPPAQGAAGLSAARHHPRPECIRHRHGHRGAPRLRPGFHRSLPLDSRQPARRQDLWRNQQCLLRVSRQQPSAGSHPHRLPVPRHSRRAEHGHRQSGAAGHLCGSARRTARAGGGSGAEPPRRRHRAPAGNRRASARGGLRPRAGRAAGMAGAAGGEALAACPGSGHRHPYRRRHGGSPAAGGAADRGHRRAADGRHEHRRRPVRRRPDVPAAGGQERPGDEAGGGPSGAFHRGFPGTEPQGQGPHRHGHGQRRCA